MATLSDQASSRFDALPPPPMSVGAAGWVRGNLFGSWYNGVLTVASVIAIGLALWFGAGWVFGTANWAVIGDLGGRFIIGQYNTEFACPGQNCFWRPQVGLLLATMLFGMAWGYAGGGVAKRAALVVAGVSAAMALLPYELDRMGMDVRLLLVANVPAVFGGMALGRYTPLGTPRWIAILGVASFVLTLVLISGPPKSLWEVSWLQWVSDSRWGFTVQDLLQPVSVTYWGGLTLNLLLATCGITLSLPLGIALALGRRSHLPVVKMLCVAFIEVFRGVPLITLLFMSKTVVPLAFPQGFPLNEVFRAAIIITLFSSAYMAENVRGGLQALHPGQAEAARALGLHGWQITLLISLPQALRNVIPAIVGQFIGLFKDTSLVYIIGMLDVVEVGRAFIQGNQEYLESARELFVFVGIVFWIFTYSMSYISRRVEEHMGVGKR